MKTALHKKVLSYLMVAILFSIPTQLFTGSAKAEPNLNGLTYDVDELNAEYDRIVNSIDFSDLNSTGIQFMNNTYPVTDGDKNSTELQAFFDRVQAFNLHAYEVNKNLFPQYFENSNPPEMIFLPKRSMTFDPMQEYFTSINALWDSPHSSCWEQTDSEGSLFSEARDGLGQTFVAIGYNVGKVSVWINGGALVRDTRMRIYGGSMSGAPGTVLGTATIPGDQMPYGTDLVTFTFVPPVPVTPGSTYLFRIDVVVIPPDFSEYSVKRYGTGYSGPFQSDETEYYANGRPGRVTKQNNQWKWQTSDWSSKDDFGFFMEEYNFPPNLPSISYAPNPTDNKTSTLMSYSSTDPNGQNVKFRTRYWYWGSNPDYKIPTVPIPPFNEWSGYVWSGQVYSENVLFQTVGWWRVDANVTSGTGKFNQSYIFIWVKEGNRPPTIPIVQAPSGTYVVYQSYKFNATSSDPDNDQIHYGFDWADGTSKEWTGNFPSGTKVSLNHIYNYEGNMNIAVTAVDWHGLPNDTDGKKLIYVDKIKPTVTTVSAITSTESATVNGNIIKDGGDIHGVTGRFHWGQGASTRDQTTNDKSSLYTSATFDDVLSGLSRMTLYNFNASAYNCKGEEGFGVLKYILTKADPLDDFTAVKSSKNSIYLDWTLGAVCDGAYIQYRVNGGSYTELGYWGEGGNSGTSYTHSGLTQGIYEYIAYGYSYDGQKSDGTSNKPFSDNPITSSSITIMGEPQITTNDASAVENTTATMNGYITSDGNPSGSGSFNFTYGFTTAYGQITANQTKNNGESMSQALSGLLIGKLYHYKIQGRAGDSFGYFHGYGADKKFMTRPENVTNFIVSPISMTELQLIWTNNNGSDGAYVEYAEGTQPSPWNIGSGTKVEGGDNGRVTILFIHSGLLRNHTYYYKAWAFAEDYDASNSTYVRSDGTVSFPYSLGGVIANQTTVSLPNLTLYDADNITNQSASLHGNVSDSGVPCTVWFDYGVGTFTNKTNNETLMMGNISADIIGLSPGQVYKYRLHGINAIGGAATQNKTLRTPPKRPTDIFIPAYGQYLVNLTWTKGVGADYTRIMAQEGHYPTGPGDGRLVYYGMGASWTDRGFQDYSNVFYRAWGYSSISDLFSEDADQVNTSVIDYEVFLPTYLNAGEYIIAWGKIQSMSGQSVDGFIATTSVRDVNDTTLVGPAYWNCTDGNYQTAISTHELTAGTYQICVEFENSIGTRFIFTYRSQLFLSYEAPPDVENQSEAAYIYYTFYNQETGTGLDDNYYKVYISADKNFSSGDRVKGGRIGVLRGGETVYTAKEYYMEIRDFNDNIMPMGIWDDEHVTAYDDGAIHNAYVGFNVTMPEYYVDMGIHLNQLRIKNMNESTVYMTLKRTNNNTGVVIGRFIPPWEETEVFIPDAQYNLTIDYYINDHPENLSQKTAYPWGYNMTIADNQFYWIKGSNLEDVIHIISNENTWIFYTIFDMNTGTKLEDDFYKIYFSRDTNFTEANRVTGGEYNTTTTTKVYYKILDYWNNLIYPWNGSECANMTIKSNETFLDIGIPFNQFLIKNTNSTLVYFRITNGNISDQMNNTWYNRWVSPFESTEIFIRYGIYNISIEYYYPNNATFIGFENLSNFTIDRDMFFVVQGKNAKVYFNFYNANEGIGIPFETMKIYANGVRLTENYIDWYQGDSMNLTIEDYYNNVIYNDTFIINDEYTFTDVPLSMYSYKFSNYKYDYFIVGIKKENSSVWWEKVVCPYETIEFLPSVGNYSIRIYNGSYNLAEFNDTINRSKAYAILGYNTSDELSLVMDSHYNVSLNFTQNYERLNITNEQLVNIIGQLPYRNQTIVSVLDEFRKPHIIEIPKLTYNYSDTVPPITTIYASISLKGNIDVTWYATDNSKKSINETLYYKIENATVWKLWAENLSATGVFEFNSTIEELVEGQNYSFKAIGIDETGNIENESGNNVCTVVYVKRHINESINVTQILTNSLSSIIFIIAVIFIFLLIIIVAVIERRKRRPEQISTLEEDRGWPYMPYEGDL